MTTSILIAAALLTAAVPAAGQVEAGDTDWDAFPELRTRDRSLPTSDMVGQVSRMLQDAQCEIPGQTHRRFDITIPYIVLIEPNGSVERVVVKDIGCPAIETYAGAIVLELAREGDFAATGVAEPRWYTSRLNFNLQ